MTPFYSRSLFWKLFLPFAVLLVLSALAVALFLPAVIQHNAERDAVEAGQETVRQFTSLRKYYTDNVVTKVLAKGAMKVSFDHLGDPAAIPLPATMVLELSAKMQQSGTTLKLYSPYPFPNRRGRVLDPFGEAAWAYLQQNPDKTYSRIETLGERSVVRVAIADKMSAPACVACHNALPGSPKTDWKLGDVRGVLEVASSRQLATGERIAYQVFGAFALILLLLALFLRLLYQRSVARPLNLALDAARALTDGSVDKVKTIEAIANGNLEQDLALARLPHIDPASISGDEVGELLRSVVSMSEAQVSLDHAVRTMTTSLRDGRAAEYARNWLKSGQNELNTLMQGEQELATLADKVLCYLAERVGAGVGALFLHDEQRGELYLAAAYAMAGGREAGSRIPVGQGLVGQAARARKAMLVDTVPPGYLPISSALGGAEPASLMVLPLLHGDNLVGAIELGGFKRFSAAEQEFLESTRAAVGIGFAVNLSRQRTRLLLHETEQQSEELRVQQEELQQSNEELEERAERLECQREQIQAKNTEVEAASREILRKAEQLQRVSAYKTEFLANMSHELRTPLNSMLILSGLLAENKANNLSVKQVEYAATIHDAGKDLLNLINDILDLSKVEAGQVEFHYEDCPARDLCVAMQNLFHLAAEQKGLLFQTALDAQVPERVRIDPQRTQQVLTNLIGNAIKFTRQGEVALRLFLPRPEENPLAVAALALAVSDTGIGVPVDKRELIFDAFKQADGGISRNYGGTGLGLSISLQLARKMGGELGLSSEEGRGSTFTLYLPLAGAAAPPGPRAAALATPPAPATPGASAGGGRGSAERPRYLDFAMPLADDRAGVAADDKSILIIEDDLGFANILMEFVRQHGFKAIVAVDGESGIALAQHFAPSAVLLDLMLPKIDGWGVMRSLKDGARTRHIPVHFITCMEERKKAMEMGALGFVTKPVSTEQLNQVFDSIEGALDKSVKQLLIVEDDAAEATSLHALLSERGVAITLAASGHEAIALLAGGHFDCMVLDLGLADMSGFELLAQIQGMEQARQIPVIVHSGRELTREQERELHRCAESIIVKGAHSPERLLNEVTLFLHMVESAMPPGKQRMIRAAIDKEAMLDGKTMLIVDDDMRNIFSLTSLLADKGIVVLEADNGKEALLRLAAHPETSVVLMDIMMPEMDGFDTMRAIRRDARHRDLPIIAMTAKVMQGDQQKCFDAGASDYIAKPIDTDKLMSLLRVWSGR